MSDQVDIFGALPDPDEPARGKHQRPGDAAYTQIVAAIKVTPKTGTQRRKVLDYIASYGEYGATDDEMQVALRMDGSTQRPRRVELVEHGWIEDSRIQRRTRKNEWAVVWTLTRAGEQQYRRAS